MGSPFLYKPDLEIERNSHLRRKKQKFEEQRCEASRTTTNMVGGGGDQKRTLRDFVTLGVQGIARSISYPSINVNNSEFKPTFISMVQQSQFGGTPLEDLNLHLSIFLGVCDTLNLNGVSTDAIRLRLFPFSLSDKARTLLHSLSSRYITT